MEIQKKNSLYRLFIWCLKVCDRFTDKNMAYRYRNQTNLCHFVRVIVFYTPLVFFLNFLSYSVILTSVFLLFFWFNLKDLGIVLLLLTATVAFTFGAVALGFKLSKLEKYEFYKITTKFIKAKKDKICPYITFEGEK